MVFAIVNQKGGVGKTTTTVNLAAALAARARAAGDERGVLIIDLDAQCNSTEMTGAPKTHDTIFDALLDPDSVPIEAVVVPTATEGVVIAPGHRAMAGLDSALREVAGKEVLLRELLEPARDRYAAIVIDNGPSLGLAIAIALSTADVALVPVSCDGPLALQGLQQVSQTIEQSRRRLNPSLLRRVLLTKVDGRNSHSKPLAATVREKMAEEVLEVEIGHSADLQRGLFNKGVGGSVLAYAPQSSAAKAFTLLAEELSTMAVGGEPVA